MALLECLHCLTKFAVGLLHCPHCLSEEFQEADVPKITVSGGASHPADLLAVSGLPVPPAASVPAEPEAVAPAAEPEPDPEPEPVKEPEPAPEPEPDPEPAPATKPAKVAAPTLSAPKPAGDDS